MWEDGHAFRTLRSRRGQLLATKEDLERKRKTLAKLHRQKSTKKKQGSSETQTEEDLELFAAEESIKNQMLSLRKKEILLAEVRVFSSDQFVLSLTSKLIYRKPKLYV